MTILEAMAADARICNARMRENLDFMGFSSRMPEYMREQVRQKWRRNMDARMAPRRRAVAEMAANGKTERQIFEALISLGFKVGRSTVNKDLARIRKGGTDGLSN